MKYTLIINQAGVVRCGLLGQVDVADLCLLDYLGGWFFSANTERVTVQGCEFVWVHYERAVEELPLLFNPDATVASRKNQLCRLVQRLRQAGLVETVPVGRKLHFRLTDKAAALASSRERTVTKSPPAVTPPRDDVVPPGHDEPITPPHDDSGPLTIDETTTIKTITKEPGNPLTPLQGERDAITAYWNSFPQLHKIERFQGNRLRALRRRLADEFFRDNWRAGIERVARSPFCTGQGERGWRANIDWFLRPDTLTKIVEGIYDASSHQSAKHSGNAPGGYHDTHF